MIENKFCLCCNNTNLIEILNLNEQPLANSYPKLPTDAEKLYPLKLNYCNNCSHLQLSHSVDPNDLFKHYVYLSGTSNTLTQYFKDFTNICKKYTAGNKVLDIACNDGTQLNCFKDIGYQTYGIDPAENLYALSSKHHNIICSYFNEESVNSFGTKFDLIIAQNVLAHNSYPLEFLKICKKYIANNGRILIQTSQANMLMNNEFDTIYHEHISFFTVKSFCKLAKSTGLKVIDVLRTPIHGTSFVFVLSNDEHDIDKSEYFVDIENKIQPVNLEILNVYKHKVLEISKNLKSMIENLSNQGYKIIGYGAAAKGNTLINFTKIKLDYVVDDNLLKQGLYLPGSKIPIFNPDKIKNENNNLIIVPLAWNFFEEIRKKVLERNSNVKFIKYFPEVELV